MTFDEWKKIKAINGEDNKKIIRDFERRSPGLAALYEKKEREEQEQMRQAMTIDDRMARWREIAKINNDPTFAERRRREVM